jgi:precorrin-3B C17-methyltransferase
MQEENVDEVKKRLLGAGLEIYPAGFVSKSLITCNFCRGAEDAGLNMAEALNDAIAGLDTPSPLKIGYAGCALGTSEPLLKDIGIVKVKETFDIYVGGDPKSIKPVIAQLLVSDVPFDRLIAIVQSIIHNYQEHGKKKEKFSRFVSRVTVETLRDAAGGGMD